MHGTVFCGHSFANMYNLSVIVIDMGWMVPFIFVSIFMLYIYVTLYHKPETGEHRELFKKRQSTDIWG